MNNNDIKVKDHLGNEFKSTFAMCRYHDILYDTFKARKDKGLPLELCLMKGKIGTERLIYKDYKGNKFPSINAMCRYHGVLSQTYRARRKRGMSLKESLIP